jgi:hypothetical protein
MMPSFFAICIVSENLFFKLLHIGKNDSNVTLPETKPPIIGITFAADLNTLLLVRLSPITIVMRVAVLSRIFPRAILPKFLANCAPSIHSW